MKPREMNLNKRYVFKQAGVSHGQGTVERQGWSINSKLLINKARALSLSLGETMSLLQAQREQHLLLFS